MEERFLEQPLACLLRLQVFVDELDSSYIQNIWHVDFSEDSDAMLEKTESSSATDSNSRQPSPRDLISKAVVSCRLLAFQNREISANGAEEGSEQGSHLWKELLDRGMDIKKLLVFLYRHMSKGNRKGASFDEKQLSLLCASLYFVLVCVRGSDAYKVFHPGLFRCALSGIRADFHHDAQPKRQGRQSTLTARQKRHRTDSDDAEPVTSQGLSIDRQANDRDDELGSVNDEENSCVLWSFTEIRKAQTLLLATVRDLVMCMTYTSFKNKTEIHDNLIHKLSALTLEEDSLNAAYNQMTEDTIFSSSKNWGLLTLAYCGLKLLCQTQHGPLKSTFLSIAKHLLPSIVMSQISNSTTISKRYQTIKERSVDFLCHLVLQASDALLPSMVILFKNICVRVVDKAEFRSHVAVEAVKILGVLPIAEYLEAVSWLHDLTTRSSKTSHRTFGVEVFFKLLSEPERMADSNNMPGHTTLMLTHRFYLSVIVCRCNDSAPSVCTKALSLLAACFSDSSPALQAICKTCFALCRHKHGQMQDVPQGGNVPELAGNGAQDPDADGDTPQSLDAGEASSNLLCRCELQDMLLERCEDSKVHVRKAALQLLENIECLGKEFSSQKVLQVIASHCLDPAILVRKQALQSVTCILEAFPSTSDLQRLWAESVLPSVLTAEATVQEKCLELVESIVLSGILDSHHHIHHRDLAWQVLSYIAISNDHELERYLQKAVYLWVKSGKIRPRLYSVLREEVGGPHDSALWLVISLASPHCAIPNSSFVLEYWKQCSENIENIPYYTVRRVLHVLYDSVDHIAQPDLSSLKDSLEKQVKGLCFPAELIPPAVETLNATCRKLMSGPQIEHDIFTPLFTSCSHFVLCSVHEPSLKTEEDFEEKMVRQVVTLGMVAQLHPKKVNSKVTNALLGVVLPNSRSYPLSAVGVLSGSAVQGEPVLSSDTAQVSETSFESGTSFGPRIQAHTFLTLGKMCLQSEALTKKVAPLLASHLETSSIDIVRSNICTILADLCMHYTLIVDPYVASMSMALKDPSLRVRHTALMVLTQLLQEDYIKWRGALYFRMLLTLVDTDRKLRSLATYSVGHLLKARHPHLFYQHFIECIFYFNGYENQDAFKMAPRTSRDLDLFCLRGPRNQARRMHLYKFMLNNMTDEQKFSLIAKLCGSVLGAFATQVIPLNNETKEVMRDTFHVCSCDEIKLSSVQSSSGAGQDADEGVGTEGGGGHCIVAAAKKVVISQFVKRNMMENVMPHVISLKQMLEQMNSPLLGSLMNFLREILKDCKMEIHEILATDPQLASEIDFEIQRIERRERKKSRNPDVGGDLDLDHTPLPTSEDCSGTIQPPAAQIPTTVVCQNAFPDTPRQENNGEVRDPPRTPADPVLPPRPPAWITSSVRKAHQETERLLRRSCLTPKQKDLLRSPSATPSPRRPTTAEQTPARVPISSALRVRLLEHLVGQSPVLPTPIRDAQDSVNRKHERFLQRAISTPRRPMETVSFRMNEDISCLDRDGPASERLSTLVSHVEGET